MSSLPCVGRVLKQVARTKGMGFRFLRMTGSCCQLTLLPQHESEPVSSRAPQPCESKLLDFCQSWVQSRLSFSLVSPV